LYNDAMHRKTSIGDVHSQLTTNRLTFWGSPSTQVLHSLWRKHHVHKIQLMEQDLQQASSTQVPMWYWYKVHPFDDGGHLVGDLNWTNRPAW
jgi:hypothetical protein